MESLENLNAFYENEGLEELRLQEGGPQYLEFLTAIRYLDRLLPPDAAVLDSCAGSGVYAFYLAEKGHRVTAGDIVPFNVDVMREKQGKQPLLTEIYPGDSRDLSRFPDGAFDAVLCMGALYHLHEEKDRRLAVRESLRVLAPGGLLFCTYMNRYAVILNNCEGSLKNIEEVLSFSLEGHEGIFYASTPEETESMLAEEGAIKVYHLGLDGMATFLRHTAGLIDDEGLVRWQEYHFRTCEIPSLLGTSYHGMVIGRKP